MSGRLRAGVRQLLRRRQPATASPEASGQDSLSAPDRRIIEQALPYTMTGVARMQALIDAVRYCVAREVSGAFAECGVWRGGSVLAMVLTLQELGVDDRDIHLYDTFEGMTPPTDKDTSPLEPPALERWKNAQETGDRIWPELFDPEVFNEASVKELLASTGYPEHRVHIVHGPVEETLPSQAPDRLALLRLDTDWYESTHHELVHLYPRLGEGGVLIVDDYGHWEGARRAVDEYLADRPLLLARVDYTGRIAVKH